MKAKIADAELLHKFKARVYLRLGVLHGAILCPEALIRGAAAEHIDARRAQIVPPRHRKGQMLAHLFAEHHFIRIVEFERERIFALRALVPYGGDILKNLPHLNSSLFFVTIVTAAGKKYKCTAFNFLHFCSFFKNFMDKTAKNTV